MRITTQYSHYNRSHTEYKGYPPSFGIRFKTPKLLTDIFVKQSYSPAKGITKIKNLHSGEFGTECKNSIPLENFEEQFGIKELKTLYKKGLSTNTEGWADCFLKSSADNPLSTSSVYDCSVMYLFNKDTNTHFLYHSYFNMDEKHFDSLIKNFMPEGFTKAEILPGEGKWYMRHWETLPEMLHALKANNKKAVINVRHYSSILPEIVGYKGNLFEIVNQRTAMGFSDKGQASFKICDLRVNSIMGDIEYNSCTEKRIAILRKMYAQQGLDKEILKVLSRLIDKQQQKLQQIRGILLF